MRSAAQRERVLGHRRGRLASETPDQRTSRLELGESERNRDYIKKGLTPYSIAERNSDPTAVCTQQISTYRYLRKQCAEMWNQRNIFVHTKILNPHPALQATTKSLEILLPAAVDLLFHSNETEGRL